MGVESYKILGIFFDCMDMAIMTQKEFRHLPLVGKG